jgi:glycosyltransferase involved in cell wall biosynthesis
MKFSIITPSYNQGRFLNKTIQSVIKQKNKKFKVEHIIVDGKSSDDTIDILKKYGLKIKWISEFDRGQANALNKGILKTNGDIIGWLNSDDIYYPSALEKIYFIFKKFKKIDIIYGMADRIDEHDKIIEQYKTLPFNFDVLKKECFICQPAVFFRRDLINKYGLFDENLNYCLDYEYWLRLAQNKVNFYYLRKKLAATRIHLLSKSKSQTYEMHEEIINTLRSKFNDVSKNWIKGFAGEKIKKNSLMLRIVSLIYKINLIINFLYFLTKYNFYLKIKKKITVSLKFFCESKLGTFEQHNPKPLKLKFGPHILNESKLLISIVTPSYNQSKYIEETIKSVINQEYRNFEYFIVDGGSSDGTIQLLKKYSHQLSGWTSKKDKGQVNAINKGFSKCNGEILCWLNSDDIFLPNTLNKVACFFNNNKDIDIIYSNRLIINENSEIIGKWILPNHSDEIIKWVDYIPQETLFFRRRAWSKIGSCLNEKFQFAMDWKLIDDFRKHKLNFFHLDDFLGAFRYHKNQKTHLLINTSGQEEMKKIREKAIGFIPSYQEINKATSNYIYKHIFKDRIFNIILKY